MSASTPLPLARRLQILVPLSLLLLVLDLWSKSWAVVHVAGHPPRTYWGIFTLVYAENLGAWGSLGAGWASQTRWLVLAVLPAVVLFALAIYALRDPEATPWEVTACALVVAGGAGNLFDRFQLGYVRDFLYVGYGRIGTNIFNVADAVVMTGLGVLLLRGFLAYRAEQRSGPSSGS